MSSAGRIALLPPSVADAIAAGEVVERPASVVKELCENALDAGATRVDVAVEGGGTVRIRVSDDGRGIATEDLPLAVARHATSKIANVADLSRVGTLGFRGEALASIAAVSDLVIVSRPHGTAAATRLHVRAAEVLDTASAAAAPGTSVEVCDLFAATPARLRFLRSLRTEAAAAVRVVSELAVAHPDVAFTCSNDGRSALRAPGRGMYAALRAVFGSGAAELLEVGAAGDISVGGAISQPRVHRSTRDGIILVVNGRRVHNRSLVVAVEEAYRGLLPTGRHPFGVVVVDLDPEMVDVNVHPAKREVHFRDDRAVFAAVQRACWAALQASRAYEVALQRGVEAGGAEPAMWATLAVNEPDAFPTRSRPGDPAPQSDPRVPATDDPIIDAGGGGLAGLGRLRALGQAGSSWMVAESPDGVVLVDPHAAHEKVLYAELLASWGEGRHNRGAVSQLLLMPVVIDCGPARHATLEANAALLAGSGFALEPFGPGLIRCTAVPAACSASDITSLVDDALDSLDAEPGSGPGRRHRLAALIACHAAVRFGDPLDPTEQQRLLDRLVHTPGAMTCPHGRPTVMLLDDAVLRRAFRRPAI